MDQRAMPDEHVPLARTDRLLSQAGALYRLPQIVLEGVFTMRRVGSQDEPVPKSNFGSRLTGK